MNIRIENGVEIEMTPEEVAAWQAEQATYDPPPSNPPLTLRTAASAKLMVIDWEVIGLERCTGVSGAFMADTDVAWVLLSEEQPDTNYIVMPADGVTKYTTHVEVTRPGLSDLSFLIFRVQ